MLGEAPGTLFTVAQDATGGTAVSVAFCGGGTRIMTESGERPVEDLRIGDVLVTASGQHRPVRWIGQRSYAGRFLAANPRVQPIRFAAGCLDDGLPHRDLMVSQDIVPAGHAAHLVRDIVREELDLGAILAAYTEARGFPPYHPGMMVALLLYAYSQGVYSSRRIARGCEERLDFQAVTALNRPDFRTISEFRRRHLTALGQLFVQVLALCQRAGLVGVGHVAVDGTKL